MYLINDESKFTDRCWLVSNRFSDLFLIERFGVLVTETHYTVNSSVEA